MKLPIGRVIEVAKNPPACPIVQFHSEVIAANHRALPPSGFNPFGAPVLMHVPHFSAKAKSWGELIFTDGVSAMSQWRESLRG